MTTIDSDRTVTATPPPTIPVMRPALGPEEAQAAAEAVASGWVAQGPRVARFEEAFADTVGAAAGVATSSCTTALHLALVLLGVGPGDEVIVPSLSFIATANVVRYVGATPVFADVDRATLGLTRETVAAAIDACHARRHRGAPVRHARRPRRDSRTVRRAGDRSRRGRGMRGGRDVSRRSRSAHIPIWWRSRSTRARSSLLVREACSSPHGRTGRTGARRLREHGMSVSAAERHASRGPILEQYLEVGFNYRMTDIQAAVGLVQLGRLHDIVARRRQLGARYRRLLAPIPGIEMIQDPPDATTNFQSFWLLLPESFPVGRDELLAQLGEVGISARRGIMAAHLEPAYAGHPCAPLPVTDFVTRRSLILPLFHDMTDDDQDRVVSALLDAAGV